MCVLCGESVMQIHWTDRKLDNENSPAVVVGEKQRARQRDRNHRIRLTNKILSYYGLALEDWSGSKYILRDKKGRIEIVQDLGTLWPAVEKMLGRPSDPLDPLLIEYLMSKQRGR